MKLWKYFFVIVVNQSRPKHDVNRISCILNNTLNFYLQIREIFWLTFFKDICFCCKVEPPFTHSRMNLVFVNIRTLQAHLGMSV